VIASLLIGLAMSHTLLDICGYSLTIGWLSYVILDVRHVKL